jgi:hypothetical protein
LWGIIAFMVAFGMTSAGTLVSETKRTWFVVVCVALTRRRMKIFQCIPVEAGWDLHLCRPPMGSEDSTKLTNVVATREFDMQRSGSEGYV